MGTKHSTFYIIYNFRALKIIKPYILTHTEQGINANVIYFKN